MRSRYPLLWLKKRGQRRTGSPQWGHSGELLYHCVFVAVGVVAIAWHAVNVLAPEWRQREQLASFDRVEAVIESTQVERQNDLCVPVWSVRITAKGEEDRLAQATSMDAAPTESEAQQALTRFEIGQRVDCYVDPKNPDRVLLGERFRLWPWLMLLIPFSLIAIGLVGLIRTVLRAGVSIERRHTVAQQANQFDPFSGGRVSVAVATALPATDGVDDSPGVKLRYRLPIEGFNSWRLTGMAVMCVTWNLLVGFFLVGVVTDLVAGRPNWAITFVVIPLACAGGWLAYSLLRDAWGVSSVGVTQVEIATHPLIPGQTGGGIVLQAGQFRARWLTVSLVCEEIATYCEGTDTRTSVQEVYRELLHRERRYRVENERPFEQAFTFTVPPNAMHSFVSPHNEVRWTLEVRGAPMRWPEFRRRFRLCVYPTSWRQERVREAEGSPLQEA
ncbi:MAG: DUF3592 domain-containing protein, partial [Planctomycetota bacterium]